MLRALFGNLNYIRKMSVFTQKINSMTGHTEWEFQNEDYDYHQEVARSAFADMLHDSERNQKYFSALKSAIEKIHASGRKANVLDIGTGTGLLSMMAVKCGADSVTACEAFKPMATCAAKVIKKNGFEQNIKLVPKRSTDMIVGLKGDMEQRANILVTEVFDTELIGESAISTFQHAHEELLENECIVVPSSATIYAQIIESPLTQNWNRLKDIADCDGDIIIKTPKEILNCPGAAAVHDLQLNQFPLERFNTIVPPIPVLKFDWSKKMPLLSDRFNVHVVKAERDGSAQMVFMWWVLTMDTKEEIILSCAPFWAHPETNTLVKKFPKVNFIQDLLPWRDHWMQAVYYFPQEVAVRKDEELSLISCHDEFSLWFNLKKGLKVSENDYLRPVCECGVHISHSRTRIGQLNDSIRIKKYLRVLEECIDSESVCLILSDGSYLGLAAAKLGAKYVYNLERNILLRKVLKSYIEHNRIEDKITIIDDIKDLKSVVDLKSITVVAGDPHFTTSLLPWDNFYFGYLKNELNINQKVTVVPKKAKIKAVAVEFLDLHKIREPLGSCEGFDMNHFDELIEKSIQISDSTIEPQPLWEYPCKQLSEIVDLTEVNFEEFSDVTEVKDSIDITGKGICNGIALWVDWDLDENYKNIITTGPIILPSINDRIIWDMYCRQGVYLIPNAKPLKPNSRLEYEVNYDKVTRNIIFKFNIDS